MNQRTTFRSTIGLPVLIGALPFVAACAGGEASGTAAAKRFGATAAGVACVARGDSPVGIAVRDYIKNASPAPQRFLSAAGTDSAVPEDGFKVLQDKGPSFYYSSDTAAQRKMRAKLEGDGPYASMLVVYHGKRASATGDTVTVTLGGHYVGNATHGTVSPTREIVVACDSSGWKVSANETTR